MSSSDADLRLRPVQLAALVILMSEAREVTNTEFSEMANFTLTGADRRGLEEPGYVQSRKADRTLAFSLTDAGWAFCERLHGAEIHLDRSVAGRSLPVLLGGVGRSLERLRLSHAEFFRQTAATASIASTVDEPGPPPAPAAPPGTVGVQVPAGPAGTAGVQAAIRAAYADIPKAADGWIGLADLREHLGWLDRSTVDEALRAMARQPGVHIIPVANTKSLKPRDHAAALWIGAEENHALWIGRA